MKRRVAAEHEVVPTFTHEPVEWFTPAHLELLRPFQHIHGATVRGDVDSRRNPLWTIEIVLILPTKIPQDLSILGRNGHRVMGINRVLLEVVGERSQEQLVKDATLLHVKIVLNLAIPPVCQILRVVINLDNNER